MGNRASAPSPSAAADGGEGSGLYLSPEVQARINSDFESRILQSEWDKYRTLHLQRHHQREATTAQREEEARARLEALRAKAKQVHGKLDERVDSAKGRLVDLEVEVGHDLRRLEDKFEGMAEEGGRALCLDARAEVASCLNVLGDDRDCAVFAQKLERCVTEALAS